MKLSGLMVIMALGLAHDVNIRHNTDLFFHFSIFFFQFSFQSTLTSFPTAIHLNDFHKIFIGNGKNEIKKKKKVLINLEIDGVYINLPLQLN